MARQNVSGWWQISQQIGQAAPAEAATQITCLTYDVDLQREKPDNELVDDDEGVNCLLKAAHGNTDLTVLSNLYGPDYALCAEPSVPLQVFPQHVQAVAPTPATEDAATRGSKGVIKKRQRRVSFQASFAGSRMVWEGIAAAARARRRPSDLVATPPPVAAASSNLKLGDPPAAVSKPPSTDTDSCSCEVIEWAEAEKLKLEEEFHRKFHEELNRKLEFEQQGHTGRSLYIPESKLKKKTCLPHWHCSVDHENRRKHGGFHPFKCNETVRITTDRMNLGLKLESGHQGLRLCRDRPFSRAEESIPAGSDTFALVSEKQRKDPEGSDDSGSVSSCSTQHSGPSCKRRSVIFKKKTENAPRNTGRRASSKKPGNVEEKKPGNMLAQSRKRHPYLKPMLPNAAIRRKFPNKIPEIQCTEVPVASLADMPAPGDSGIWSSCSLTVGHAARTSEAHQISGTGLRALRMAVPPGRARGTRVQSGQLDLVAPVPVSRLSKKSVSFGVRQTQDPSVREIHITPWNNHSPRPDLLTGSNVGNASEAQLSAFCFRIPLPGERCLQVKAEAEPNEVHISVCLQEPGKETADKADPTRDQQPTFSTRSSTGSGVTNKKALNVSWTCPDILCPGSASGPHDSRAPSPQPANPEAVLLMQNCSKSLEGGDTRQAWSVQCQGFDARGAASKVQGTTEELVCRNGERNCLTSARTNNGARSPIPTARAVEETKAQTNLQADNIRYSSASLQGTASSVPGPATREDKGPPSSCRNIEIQPARREKPDKRGDPNPDASPYSGLQEMMEWQKTLAEYKSIKGSQTLQADETRSGKSRFTKSSHKFLTKLSRKSGAGECLCVKAFKPYSDMDIEEKENQMIQKCNRGCHMAASSTSKPKRDTWSVLPVARLPSYSSRQQEMAGKGCPQSDVDPSKSETEQVSFVVGTRSRAGRKHWLALFRKAISEKSQLLQRNSDTREQTPRPFSTGTITH